jgi:hypothetical protein
MPWKLQWLRTLLPRTRGAHAPVSSSAAPAQPPPLVDTLLLQSPTIVLVRNREEAPFNQDYRFSDDPPDVIRLQQAWPPGIDAELVTGVHVAGISYEPALTHARAFIAGHTRTITLEREPTNRYDRHAIAVMGHWTAPNGGRHQGRLGYVPAETAAEIAEAYPEGPLGVKIWWLFRPSEGKSPGIRMNIGCSMQVYETWQARQL